MTHLRRQRYSQALHHGLQWTPDTARQAALQNIDGGPSIYTAIQEQLGLRLRSEKTPIDVLVIDHVEKPAEN